MKDVTEAGGPRGDWSGGENRVPDCGFRAPSICASEPAKRFRGPGRTDPRPDADISRPGGNGAAFVGARSGDPGRPRHKSDRKIASQSVVCDISHADLRRGLPLCPWPPA